MVLVLDSEGLSLLLTVSVLRVSRSLPQRLVLRVYRSHPQRLVLIVAVQCQRIVAVRCQRLSSTMPAVHGSTVPASSLEGKMGLL